jgi:hypothetical protein
LFIQRVELSTSKNDVTNTAGITYIPYYPSLVSIRGLRILCEMTEEHGTTIAVIASSNIISNLIILVLIQPPVFCGNLNDKLCNNVATYKFNGFIVVLTRLKAQYDTIKT